MLMENKFYDHHVIKHAAIAWDTIGWTPRPQDHQLQNVAKRKNGERGTGNEHGERQNEEGVKKPHLIPSPISNFITHSVFFVIIVFIFPFPALVPRSLFPVSRSPFLVLVT